MRVDRACAVASWLHSRAVVGLGWSLTRAGWRALVSGEISNSGVEVATGLDIGVMRESVHRPAIRERLIRS